MERKLEGTEGTPSLAPPDAAAADGDVPITPELEVRELKHGRQPGGRYVRVVRPHGKTFRHGGRGHLVATEAILAPKGGIGRIVASAKHRLIGQPLRTAQLSHERLSKVQALAVLSSDALSSSAYATDEILLVLVMAGAAGLGFTLPVALAIGALLAIVALSYRQTIQAYPQGGGAYIVAKDNLGTLPALLAGSALLIDYTLTVAVSISSGVANIASALTFLQPYRVELAVGLVVLVTVANLRGVRESGRVFAAPTYLFIVGVFVMVIVGAVRMAMGTLEPAAAVPEMVKNTAGPVTIFLLLRAFSSGCAALTGVEAISDGVPAFKPPEARNARITLGWMAGILGVLFLGISFLAHQMHIMPREHETVVSQIARLTFGTNMFYYFVLAVTMLILVLAANTSFADFPRLSYFLARDNFMPRQFSFRGDRLAFSTGIIVLGSLATLLVITFHAETHRLIPLYAVGVFISFTVSQFSMVRRHLRVREPGWRRGLIINLAGAATTGVVAAIIASTKFMGGAWIVLVLIPVIVASLLAIRAHYRSVADQLTPSLADEPLPPPKEQIVVVPVWRFDRSTIKAITYARSISRNVRAIFITDDLEEGAALRKKWEQWADTVPLVILESPYRSLTAPVVAYVDAIREHNPGSAITVVLAEFVPRHWWEWLLHNQSAFRLKVTLFFRRGVVVTDVPYHLSK